MGKFFKSTYVQNILMVTAIAALVIASLLNMTSIVALAMSIGVIGGVASARYLMKSTWNKLEKDVYPIWLRYLTMFIAALIASQIAWAALLV